MIPFRIPNPLSTITYEPQLLSSTRGQDAPAPSPPALSTTRRPGYHHTLQPRTDSRRRTPLWEMTNRLHTFTGESVAPAKSRLAVYKGPWNCPSLSSVTEF